MQITLKKDQKTLTIQRALKNNLTKRKAFQETIKKKIKNIK